MKKLILIVLILITEFVQLVMNYVHLFRYLFIKFYN